MIKNIPAQNHKPLLSESDHNYSTGLQNVYTVVVFSFYIRYYYPLLLYNGI